MPETIAQLQANLTRAYEDLEAARAELAKLNVFRDDLAQRLAEERQAASAQLGTVQIEDLVTASEKQAASQIRILALENSIGEVERRLPPQASKVRDCETRVRDARRDIETAYFRARELEMRGKIAEFVSELETMRASWPRDLAGVAPNYVNFTLGQYFKAIEVFKHYQANVDRMNI